MHVCACEAGMIRLGNSERRVVPDTENYCILSIAIGCVQGSPIVRGGRLRQGDRRQSATHCCRVVAAEAETQQAEQDTDAHLQPRPMLANSVTELIGKSPPAPPSQHSSFRISTG